MEFLHDKFLKKRAYEHNQGKHLTILILLIIITLTIDLATKLIFANQNFPLIDGVFSIYYLKNYGGAMGLFLGNYFLLIFIAVVIIIALIIYFIFMEHKTYSFTIGMAVVFGGAIGNLTDRLFFGFVRDFVRMDFLSIFNNPVFNIADLSITIGLFFIAYYFLAIYPKITYNIESIGRQIERERLKRLNKKNKIKK